ncbi:hypothetical protein PRVXT_002953 [Proteinivorax tanatarense]|uniref:Peptidase MA-like domain-containing protein n=1 Tax=Proteinivorax tanatarense TaxID=1260629 RepID=A0AAU7VM09_9FIRM
MGFFLKIKNNKILLPTIMLTLFLVIVSINSVNFSNKHVKNATAVYHRNVAYRNWVSVNGKHVDVRYKKADQKHAEFIKKLGDDLYLHLKERYSYTPTINPLIVIYPSQQEMLQNLGWENDKYASGVYQSGTIRLLSPTQWYNGDNSDDIHLFYKENGPLLHELTHHFVDEMTGGNYPTWYTEALAQLEEYKKYQIQWIDEDNSNPNELFAFKRLNNNFYGIENQALAYRQSLIIAIFMEEKFGHNIHKQLLMEMDVNTSFEQAMKKLTGTDKKQLEKHWETWIKNNKSKYFGKI